MDINDFLKHDVQIQRIAMTLTKEHVFSSLDEAYLEIEKILKLAEPLASKTKLDKTEREITKAVRAALESGWSSYTNGITETAIYSADWYSQQIGTEMPRFKSIQSYIDSALMSLNSGALPKVGVWQKFVDENVDGVAEQVNNFVRAGFSQSQTRKHVVAEIEKFIKGQAKTRAETLARTGMTHYQQQARNAMAQANADIIEREVPLVMFDNRTSQRCIGIDSKYHDGWPLGESPIGYPPYHANCRTQIIYWLDGDDDPRKDITRIAIGSGDNYERGETYKGRKDLKAERFKLNEIKADSTYAQWLSKQDRAFITDVLGATKAKLFLDGKLPLSRMSDMLGQPLTLEQLRAKNAAAFERAGIE